MQVQVLVLLLEKHYMFYMINDNQNMWWRSSVWLERLPVTQEVEGSSPFVTATTERSNDDYGTRS